jgi:polar amino acid transport system substrate-binding protein
VKLRAAMVVPLCAWTAAASAGELRLVVQIQTAPYIYHDEHGALRGIAIDILEAAARRMGDTLVYSKASQVRLLPAAKRAPGVDGAAPVQGKDGDGLYFSAPFFGFDDVVVTRRASAMTLNSLADLDRYNFSIWQSGWRHLGRQFEATYKPDTQGKFKQNYHEYAEHETIVKVFWARRVDAAVVDRYVFNWYTSKLAAHVDTTAPVKIHEIFPERTMYKIAFREAGVRDRFNAALKAITDDGTVRNIMRKY